MRFEDILTLTCDTFKGASIHVSQRHTLDMDGCVSLDYSLEVNAANWDEDSRFAVVPVRRHTPRSLIRGSTMSDFETNVRGTTSGAAQGLHESYTPQLLCGLQAISLFHADEEAFLGM